MEYANCDVAPHTCLQEEDTIERYAIIIPFAHYESIPNDN